MGTSISPPRRTLPARAKTLVPLLLSVPSAANASAPWRRIQGTRAKVSTLLISVGLAPQSASRPDRAAAARHAAAAFERSRSAPSPRRRRTPRPLP